MVGGLAPGHECADRERETAQRARADQQPPSRVCRRPASLFSLRSILFRAAGATSAPSSAFRFVKTFMSAGSTAAGRAEHQPGVMATVVDSTAMQASAGPGAAPGPRGPARDPPCRSRVVDGGPGSASLEATAVTQVAGRAFFAAPALFALVLAMERRRTLRAFLGMGRSGLAMRVFLAISSGAFLLALNHTSVANVLFMQAARTDDGGAAGLVC